MASSCRQRSSSPLRHFHNKLTEAVEELSHSLVPSSNTAHYSAFNPTATSRRMPSTPNGTTARAMSPAPDAFKFKLGSPSLPPHSHGFSAARSAASMEPEKESVLVTVRFRPLSLREINRGDEIAWFADGDKTVCSEYNPSTTYGFDRVFGPATTTRAVYDAASRHVVRGTMEGVNGTVFAYGVTSSGKTHTMHGDQRSPGIIPLAVKDVFNIIQDTPGREYLLRVSYLEIYNEVINDLLDPAGQNLRIREDAQGTYVEGIKEEVVLSPAHALSLIAAGEEHRHVGSNNFNLLSSRSHTIFTLTIESSSRSGDCFDDAIRLSQLNLIDLAGSESSKTETTGLRRKEGSYINKSLLTLGTVISKLSEGKASHVPYRDSKLTRLLQSSLSGKGRVSLICTLTPASSNMEETHNTLKFAHRAKHVALHAATNRIMDEKSIIKKYQKEISNLKHELNQLKRGIFNTSGTTQEDFLSLRQQLEAGQVKLQSRLEEEEQAKAALLGRIQRLTKLILVSTKNSTLSQEPEQQYNRRRHSFGEEDLKRTTLDIDDDPSMVPHDIERSLEGKIDVNGNFGNLKDDKKSKRRGMLGWFKLRKHGSFGGAMNLEIDGSQYTISSSDAPNTPHLDHLTDTRVQRQRSFNCKSDESTPVVESLAQSTLAGELFSATRHGQRLPPSGETMADQMDLLREQVKVLAGEVAFCTSSLKRMLEQAINNPDDSQLQCQIMKSKVEIKDKRRQIEVLEQRIVEAGQAALNNASPLEMSETIAKLMGLLNEKEFELELRSADNRILQDQLQSKVSEVKQLQERITAMQKQTTLPMELPLREHTTIGIDELSQGNGAKTSMEFRYHGTESSGPCSEIVTRSSISLPDPNLQSQMLVQAAEMEEFKQEKVRLMEENEGLQIQSRKLAEEASYAKELASAAAVELKTLADEVKKLSLHNSKLVNDIALAQQEAAYFKASRKSPKSTSFSRHIGCNGSKQRALISNSEQHEIYDDIDLWSLDPEDVKQELHARKEREAGLEAVLAEKEQVETELRKKLEESKLREAGFENDLAGMWVLVAKLKNNQGKLDETDELPIVEAHTSPDKVSITTNSSFRLYEAIANEVIKKEEADNGHLNEGGEAEKLRTPSTLKAAITRLKGRSRDIDQERDQLIPLNSMEERNPHFCKVCFEAPTAVVLLPCRHFCLCKPCAVACTECPLCRSGIADRIITFTS